MTQPTLFGPTSPDEVEGVGRVKPAEALVTAWLLHQAYRGHSEMTIKRRRWTFNHWLAHCDEVEEHNPEGVESFLMRWSSPSTRRAVLSDLRAFYRWAVPRGYVGSDPTSLVDTPKRSKRRPTPISGAHVNLLLANTEPPRRTMIALGALAGLRVSEIAALETTHVNLRDNVLTVRGGKGGKDRHVPISPRLAGELAGWLPGRYFPGLKGNDVSYRIRTELRRLEVPGRPHDLRAAFCTELYRVSKDLMLVAQVAGHESVQTTQDYVEVSSDAGAFVSQLFAA